MPFNKTTLNWLFNDSFIYYVIYLVIGIQLIEKLAFFVKVVAKRKSQVAIKEITMHFSDQNYKSLPSPSLRAS